MNLDEERVRLLACPECGAPNAKLIFHLWRMTEGCNVWCSVCGLGTPEKTRGALISQNGIEEGIRRWNAVAEYLKTGVCTFYMPDHNGECLICDEWAHDDADHYQVCLGCGKPVATSDCGCPAGTGWVRRSGPTVARDSENK